MAGPTMFQELDMLRREFDQWFRGFGGGSQASSFLPGVSVGGYPRISLSEDEKSYFIEAVIPGVDPKDIDLNLMEKTLTLAGERKADEQHGHTWHRHERGAGKFMRTIELPNPINGAKVDAEYRNGILLITLPKQQSAKPKKISVWAN